jgi:hypothetical protein
MKLSPTAQKEWDDLQAEDSLSIPLTYDQKQAKKRLERSKRTKAQWQARRAKFKPLLRAKDNLVLAVQSVENSYEKTAKICKVSKTSVRNILERNKNQDPDMSLYIGRFTTARLWEQYLLQLNIDEEYPNQTCLMYFNEILKRIDEGCDPLLLEDLKANRALYGIKS